MENKQMERLFKVLDRDNHLSSGYYRVAACLPKQLVLQAAELFCEKRNKREFYGFVKAVLVERYRKGSKLNNELLFDELMVYLTKGSSFRSRVVEMVLNDLFRTNLVPAAELEYYRLIGEIVNAGLASGAQLSYYVRSGKLNNEYRLILGDVTLTKYGVIKGGVDPLYYGRLCRAMGYKKTTDVHQLSFEHKTYGKKKAAVAKMAA